MSMALPPHLEQYQQHVLQLKRSPYMDWPAHVHLETYAICNAACSFCPYPALARQGEKMPDELIAKIINDLTDIPRTIPFQLSPFKVNEPFLDNRLFDILQTINEKLPHATLTLTTNASPLTRETLRRLSTVGKLGYLWISFNDHRPEEYEKVMQLPYRRTIERLDELHARKAAGDIPFRVVLSRVGDSSPADAEFCGWVATHYPEFETSVFQRGGWIGQVKTDMPLEVPQVGCTRWFDLSITATGVVAHCCMDGQAAYPIGDTRKQHVLEIYNTPAYRALREKLVSRSAASPCNKCSFL
jgi:hypothetical protein